VLGWGPGAFAAEFVPHRLRAEQVHRRHLPPQTTSGSYSETHNEYLQAAAEAGVPVALISLAGLAALLFGLLRTASTGPGRSAEAIVLIGLLSAGLVEALAWFPLQRPITAVPLLLAAGRAWRLAAEQGSEAALP
ncbi:MAG: hypothetical protein V1750_01800, partial [Acidobacteriota bacterium]